MNSKNGAVNSDAAILKTESTLETSSIFYFPFSLSPSFQSGEEKSLRVRALVQGLD